jgi:hypothetical protein
VGLALEEVLPMRNWEADAFLEKIVHAKERSEWKYVKSGKLKSLVKQVMSKRPADRRIYLITVGKKRYDAAAVEALADQLMTDTYIYPGQG